MRRNTFKIILQDKRSCHSTKKETEEKEEEKRRRRKRRRKKEEKEEEKKEEKMKTKEKNRNRKKKTNGGFSMELNQREVNAPSIGSDCAINFSVGAKKNDVLTASVCFIQTSITRSGSGSPIIPYGVRSMTGILKQ